MQKCFNESISMRYNEGSAQIALHIAFIEMHRIYFPKTSMEF